MKPAHPLPALRRHVATPLALLVLCAASAAMAQSVFRQVGPDGRVTYSDRPLPSAAASSTGLPSTSPINGATPLPYELRQVSERFPVVLYSASECGPCDQARRLLQQRGVPFTERSVQSPQDVEALQRISGSNSLPFATVGSQHLKGFESGQWNDYLNLAGYPSRSQLPEGYRAPGVQPLTAATPAAPATTAPASPGTAPNRPATPAAPTERANPNNPAGIVF